MQPDPEHEGRARQARRSLVLVGAYGLAVTLPDLALLSGHSDWQRLAVVGVDLAYVAACAVGWWRARSAAPERLVAIFYVATFAVLLVRGCLIDHALTSLGCAAALLIVATASRVVPAARVDRYVHAAVLGAIALGGLDLLAPASRVAVDPVGLPHQFVLPALLVVLAGLALRELPRYPLATKLTLVSLLVALAPLLVARLASQRSLAAVDLELALQDMSARSSRSASGWDHLFARQLAVARNLAGDDAVTAACAGARDRVPELERRLAPLLAGPVSSAMVWDRSGWLLAGAGPDAPPPGAAPKDSLPRPGVNLTVDAAGVDRLVIAAPVEASDGATIGTVAVAVRPGLLRDWSAAASNDTGAVVVVRDRDDRPLFGPPELAAILPGATALPPPPAPAVTPDLPQPPAAAAARLADEKGLAGVAWLPTAGWTLAVVRDESEIAARVAGRERHMRGITLLVAALASLAALLLSRRLARPIVELAAAMARFTGGHTDARAPATDDDEIGELARRFDLMAEQVGGLVRSLEQQTRRLQAEVAERSEQEQKLQALNKELTIAHDQAQAANRAKSTFLAHMSHELRTPLNAIIGYGEMLRDQAGEHNLPEVARDSDNIVSSAQHLLEIINDILDLSKIEAGKMDLVLEEFDGVRLVRDLAEVVRPLVAANHNRLIVRCELESVRMYGDRLKLRQALINLLGNAGKFTKDGEVILALETTTLAGLPCVCFSVKDTGPGIPPEALPTLFDPFTQVAYPAQRKQSGTGLGLAITRRFARLLGGEIDVVSEVGRGSTFSLTLPTTYKGKSETGSWRPLRSFRKLEETSKFKPV